MIICHQCCKSREEVKIQLDTKGLLPKKGSSTPSSIIGIPVPRQMLSPVSQIKSHKLSPVFAGVKAVSTPLPVLSMPSICKIQNMPIFKINYINHEFLN